MSNSIGVIILAAGKGTRMKFDSPKALMPALGKPLLDYVLMAVNDFSNHSQLNTQIALVIGHQKELLEDWHVKSEFKNSIKLAYQVEQKGTADAVKAAVKDCPELWSNDYTLITCADTPLISSSEFEKLFSELKNDSELLGVAATFEAKDPMGYGRIIRSDCGFRIVEEKDADEFQKSISEVNSGFYIVKTSHLKNVLGTIDNKNKSGEFYLTDLFKDHFNVKPVKFPSSVPFLGVNNLEQLSSVSEIFRERVLKKLFHSGVMILNPSTAYIESEVEISSGVTIYPGVTILGKTKISNNVIIESNCFIKDSVIAENVSILANSYIESAIISKDASIGPMARLRPGTEIGEKAKVGNFVEIKKSKLMKGAKVSHLSYVGDAEIGENTNIGCGFITCNYDGFQKHKTIIGKNSFIGSDCQMVAPIKLGDEVFVAAGSTITKDIPEGGFAIARSQQVIKEGLAKKFLKSKK